MNMHRLTTQVLLKQRTNDASISSVLQPKFEAVLSEIDMVVNDLCYTISNLQSWIQPTYVGTNLVRCTLYHLYKLNTCTSYNMN